MSIEQHAEAAANDIGETPDSTHGVVEHIIAKHIQSAIDEATAPLRARIAVLEGLGPLIEQVKRYAIRVGMCEDGSDLEEESSDKLVAVLLEVHTILKGGAP